jgi:hypothetical protein
MESEKHLNTFSGTNMPNKDNPALDVYVNTIRDVIALKYFEKSHYLSRAKWDQLVGKDVQKRLLDAYYVRINWPHVTLTAEGLEVIQYREPQPQKKGPGKTRPKG